MSKHTLINSERGLNGYSKFSIGRYTYYELGDVTLGQLKKEKIIDCPVKNVATNKPDGLVVLGKKIVACVELKQDLSSSQKIEQAKLQSLKVAQEVKSKVLIVASASQTFYFNAFNGDPILQADEQLLTTLFVPTFIKESSFEELQDVEELLEKMDRLITAENSLLKSIETIDPYGLARQVWQDIWVVTGKSPEQCLYNVVELFIFKFLSDLGILYNEKGENAFQHVVGLDNNAVGLKYYANNIRPTIKEKFPAGEDGTTIINGTIFVTEKGEPNLARADLFMKVLKKFATLPSLHHIDKNFKTKLYESFLRQQVSQLGQFFTPRKIVQAIVKMAQVENMPDGATVLDPFCGVGGFLLEAINMNRSIEESYKPVNGVISPRLRFRGYDKGSDEKEDQRTIILAKANMLVYLCNVISKYHSDEQVKAFAGEFNKTFKLLRNHDLGTFYETNHELVDLILTNPPYVTSGTSTTNEILDKQGLRNWYCAGGQGMEGLALEWIVRTLKPNGWAYVVVPDGILSRTNDKSLRDWVSKECFIRGIISLPIKTFYSVSKKTYILALQKKANPSLMQVEPVFTYLVSEIGETRNANRFECNENDLPDMTRRFLAFKGSYTANLVTSQRCKVIDAEEFRTDDHWLIDRRFWDDAERIALGLEREKQVMNTDEFMELVSDIEQSISSLKTPFNAVDCGQPCKTSQITVGEFFKLSIGKRVTKKDIYGQEKGKIPIYSANVFSTFGWTDKVMTNMRFHADSVLWGIDGDWLVNYMAADKPFYPTDHCGVLRTNDKTIHLPYIVYALQVAGDLEGFSRSYRASITNMNKLKINIPINPDGSFNLEEQKRIATKYEQIENVKRNLADRLKVLIDTEVVIE